MNSSGLTLAHGDSTSLKWVTLGEEHEDDRLFPRQFPAASRRNSLSLRNSLRKDALFEGQIYGNNNIFLREDDSIVAGYICTDRFDWPLIRESHRPVHTYTPFQHLRRLVSGIIPLFKHSSDSFDEDLSEEWSRARENFQQKHTFISFPLDIPNEADLLVQHLDDSISGTAFIPEGLTEDSVAISTIKQLLAVDLNLGTEKIKTLMRASSALPFRFGYFQISLAGTLLATLRKQQSNQGSLHWVWSEIDYLRRQGLAEYDDQRLGFSLLASLVAVGLINENADRSCLTRLKQEISSILNEASSDIERIQFLRFLADSLNQAITEENLSQHAAKLFVFFEHVARWPNCLRPQNQLLCLISNTYFMTQETCPE